VIIFYDGYCPLCIAEMRHLRKRDKHNKLTLVDIQAPDFSNRYPTMDAWVGYMHRFAGLLFVM